MELPNDRTETVSSEVQPPRKRFRILKLEERIAPGNGHGNGSNATCGQVYTCQQCGSNHGCGSISGSVSGSFSTSGSY